MAGMEFQRHWESFPGITAVVHDYQRRASVSKIFLLVAS